MIRTLICITLCIILSSCGLMKDFIPSLGKSNTATSQDTAQFQVKPNMAIGEEATSYQGSVHDELDKSTSNASDIDTGDVTNVVGSNTNKSKNNTKVMTTTKNNTDDDSYSGESIHIQNTDIETMTIIIISFMIMMLFFVGWTLFVYRLGLNQMSERERKLISNSVLKTYEVRI